MAAQLDCLEQCAAAIVTERLASPRLARPGSGAFATGAIVNHVVGGWLRSTG